MIVIAFLQLVLDHDGATFLVLRDRVNAEGTGGLFPLSSGKLESRGLADHVDVLLQPCREVVSFVPPHLAQCYPMNASNHLPLAAWLSVPDLTD
ncbi:hypothetical protein [Candidatus Palauibacter sp.]|uniref:hypothetical protein n=1 Tax=Candidatus Palauibacter sp. TaxID=3101350 RepID=UPI003C6EAC07